MERQDVYQFDCNGEVLLYNVANRCAGSVDDPPIVANECNDLPQRSNHYERDKKCHIKFLSLHIAHECPLRCEYCYGNGGSYGDTGSKRMSLQTIRRAVDYMFAHCSPDPCVHVNFFGGEPLLAFETIKEAVEYGRSMAKRHDKVMEFSISTSALMLDDEMLDFLARNRFSVSVSIDCSRTHHDKHRKFADGGGSYEEVVDGFRKLTRRGITTLVTATLTSFTLESITGYRNLVALGADNFRFKTITGSFGYLNLTGEDFTLLASKYEQLAKDYLEDIMAGSVYDFGDFTKWIYRLNSNKTMPYSCTATEDYVNVDPDGGMFICHKFVGVEDGKLGNVYDIDSPISPIGFDIEQSRCKACWAHAICLGGCYFDGYEQHGNVYHTYNTNKCKIHQAQIKGAIYIYVSLKRRGILSRFIDSITSSKNMYQLAV